MSRDFETDYTAARRALMRLRDAFEEIEGRPDNPRSKEALRMMGQLRQWGEEYGIERLAEAERAHQKKLDAEL